MDTSPTAEQPAIAAPEPADLEPIVRLAAAAGPFSAEEIATVRELIDEYFRRGAEASGYHFLVARPAESLGRERGAPLLGFACFGPRPLTEGTFDLYWIVVAPEVGRHGIGAALLERVTGEIRRLGGRLLVAETSGTSPYLPAQRFYLRHGFDRAALIADFYAPGDDLMLFVRRL